MILFRVKKLTCDYSTTFTPFMKPTFKEIEAAAMPPTREMDLLRKALLTLAARGYARGDAKAIVEGIWNHWAFDMGYIYNKVGCAEHTLWEVRQTIPSVQGATRNFNEFPSIPMLLFAGAIAFVGFMAWKAVAPITFDRKILEAPQGLYWGIYRDSCYWMYLYYVGPEGEKLYRIFGENAPFFTAHKAGSKPWSKFRDTFWTGGYGEYRRHALGMYRFILPINWEADFCGFLTHMYGDTYKARIPDLDTPTPSGPWFAGSKYISDISKCDNPFDWSPTIGF